jgi:uncharacterized protein
MSKINPLKLEEPVSNLSANPSFDAVLASRMSRRNILRGSVGTALTAAFGTLGLTACGGSDDDATPAAAEKLLGFTAVAKSIADVFTVPAGYTATPFIAVGDPLFAGISAYANDGSQGDFDKRCGEWHDGMEYFGLNASGARDDKGSDRGLLGINHEWVSQEFLHANGATVVGGVRTVAAEVDKEMDAMGVSVVEVKKTNGVMGYVQGSSFNRRITHQTPIALSGPVKFHPLLKTKYSTNGAMTRGTVNNCGTGKTPWGTLLTGEENWAGFFARNAGDNLNRSAKENYGLKRYGREETGTAKPGAYLWETVASGADKYVRFNVSVLGATSADDYRNEINGQGWITEIDPYSATSTIKKRTTMGRMAHEGAAFSLPVAGKPLAVYMGDDSSNEYIYKFVSDATWSDADATASNRMAVGDKYLDQGTLYAAKFNADGTGEWVELSMNNPAVRYYTHSSGFSFADDGEVLIYARIAADAAGATKMDRPEWSATNPGNGEIYLTLTNNSSRTVDGANNTNGTDAANPRSYTDNDGLKKKGNVHGHIVRIKDANGEPSATSFNWDVYLFGSEADSDGATVNLSGLTDDQDFSSPDGIVFSKNTGICWIQTDDGNYTDVTNCMMLAGLPGKVGDGGPMIVDHGTKQVTTQMGAKPTEATLKRFLVGPVGQEITGMTETPDGKVMFVNVQHPEGNWPANAGYGAGGATGRPRSATVMITKNDGGRVGS